MTVSLIVGLGNPGPEYAKTRHNAGYWFIEQLAEQLRAPLQHEAKFKSLTAQVEIQGHSCRLLQPTTFMNLSGQAVLAAANFYKISPGDILVVHDELDLPVGAARLKLDGGHGGHNGLRDIMARLGSNQFYRLRLGIGHPGNKDDVHDYVLKKASISDTQLILGAIDKSLKALPDIVAGNINKAMNFLHTENK